MQCLRAVVRYYKVQILVDLVTENKGVSEIEVRNLVIDNKAQPYVGSRMDQ